MRNLESQIKIDDSVTKATNLVSRLSAKDLETIGEWVWDGYQADLMSREPWERRTSAAMDLAMQIQEDKNFPWPGCSNVIFPLVTIASLQFSSRSYGNIVTGSDVVKYRVTGGEDPDGERLKKRADRISKHMSWQVLEEDTCWEEQHDRLLINLGIVGCNFIKTFFSPKVNHNVSELIMARDLVINYWAKSVEECPRKTHITYLTRNEVYQRVVTKRFKNVLNEAWFNNAPSQVESAQTTKQDNRIGQRPPPPDRDTPFKFLEQHRYLDLDGDGYQEPYIVTMEETSKCVVKIAARWEREEDIEYVEGTREILKIKSTEYFTKYGFIPAPDGGIYDLGFGTLLGPINESVNSGINQILDAGTMHNSNGGFLGRGVKIRGGMYTIAPFQWVRVDSTGDDLRKSMVPFPTKEPSDVMFKLLGLLIEYADRIAGTTDPMVGVNPGQNTPAETSRNTMEQGMKVYSGIYKRIWRSMKEEFKKLHQLNGLFLPSRQRFGTEGSYITREDYLSDPDLVIPVADPNIVSDGLRLVQAQAIREAAHTVPGYDIAVAEKNYLRALKVDSIDTYYLGVDKTGPLPNPKVQVEQMKAEIANKKIELDKMKYTGDLMEQRKLNQANINKLNAEILKILNDMKVDNAAQKIEAFELAVDTLVKHDEMLRGHIDLMQQAQGNQDDQSSGSGSKGGAGMEGVAQSAPGANAPSLPSSQPAVA
jgi:chaperonin GroES